MGTNVNFGDILGDAAMSNTDYSPLPEDEYDLSILECVVKVTSTGKPMLSLKTQVESGPHARRLVWDNLVISHGNPQAMGIFAGKLNALGFTPEYLKTNNPDLETIADALINRRFRAKVGQSEYNGKTRNELKAYYPDAFAVTAPPAAAVPQMTAAATPPPAMAPAPAMAPVMAPAPVMTPVAAPPPAPF